MVLYPYNLQTGEPYSEKRLKEDYPNTHLYLVSQRDRLSGRGYFEKSGKKWFELWCQRDPNRFTKRKLVTPEIASGSRFALDSEGCAFNTKVYGLLVRDDARESDLYLLASLNSKLLDFLYKLIAPRKAGGFYAYKTQFLKRLPIRTIDFSDPTDKARHDRTVKLVEMMLKLHKQFAATKTSHEKTTIQRRIDATDKQIDQLVYKLYGLTDKEIRIVEEATRK